MGIIKMEIMLFVENVTTLARNALLEALRDVKHAQIIVSEKFQKINHVLVYLGTMMMDRELYAKDAIILVKHAKMEVKFI